MKTTITTLLFAFLISFSSGHAQQNEECMNNLSIFHSYVKNKKYDDAYEPWKLVRTKCPKLNRAIIVDGEKILKHKIENTSGAEQLAHIKDFMALYDEAAANYSSKYPYGEAMADKANLAYKHRDALNMSNEQLFNMFNDVYVNDKTNFNSAVGLYTYFSLIVDLYDEGKKPIQDMFDKYDDVNEIIEALIAGYTKKLNVYASKEAEGQELSKKEKRYKSAYLSNIEAFENQILGSMDKKLGDRANCDVLIPLYEKNYDKNKEDKVWLQRAMNRMYAKGCKDDPMFLKLVEQKNTLEPSADTSFYLYLLTGKQKYFDQTIELETDPLKKASLYKKLAQELRSKGSYSKARNYYQKAMSLNPSDGSPHLSIANMYAKSANNCGDDNFNKRAVFWLAANEAEKAGRIDSRLRSTAAKTAESYRASAPSRSDIFTKGNAGEVIRIGCWINRSVTVPKL